MRIKKETELNNLDRVEKFYHVLSQKLKDKINIIIIERDDLSGHLERWRKSPIPKGREHFRLDQKHKREYFEAIRGLDDKIRSLALFREKLLDKYEAGYGLIDIDCNQDTKNRLMHTTDKIMSDEVLLTGFINHLSDSIISNNPNNFYTLMCIFLEYSLDIKTFSIHSKIAILLTNSLFDTDIKDKHKPTSTKLSITAEHPHCTAKQKRGK